MPRRIRGSTSQCSVPGRRVQSTRATAPLRSRVLMRPAGGEQRSEEDGEIGIVAHDEDVVVFHQVADEVLKLLHASFGRKSFGYFDLAVVTGFRADQ